MFSRRLFGGGADFKEPDPEVEVKEVVNRYKQALK
jgi:hypothetical protein